MGSREREAARLNAVAPVVYRLDDRATVTRARASAVLGTATHLGPALLVVVLLTRLGYVPDILALAGGVALLALALVRVKLKYRQIVRHLRAFEVGVTAGELTVTTVRGPQRIVPAAIERVTAVGGALGGLRVEIGKRGAADAQRLDIPRGGEAFGELRAALERWGPIERMPRRRRLVRATLGVLVVFAIFFVPFFMADLVDRSRTLAVGAVFALWLLMLVARGRDGRD